MKIKIRKLKLNDKERLQNLFLNEKNLKDTGVNVLHEEITSEFTINWLSERIQQYQVDKPEFIVYAIINDMNTIIGTIGVDHINYKTKSAEIGYWISEQNSCKGYCTIAIDTFIKKFGKLLNIERFLAEVNKNNIASYRVLEKNEFKVIKETNTYFLLEKLMN